MSETPKNDAIQLSNLQLAVMRILWVQEEATVNQVHAALQSDRDLAPTTVATVLSRLEKKGLITHRTEGRQYVYRPTVTSRDVRRSMVADLIDQLFQGDPAALVNHLLNHSEISQTDLEQVKTLIEAKEKGEGA